tara:strand:- start:2316 stop:3185 length:870 start_codon:yes stop_codon:yes gene_type:complete
MYFDEEIVLDTRLNYLDKYVDYFVIIESCFTHRGEERKLNFDIKKYEKFKNKIIYKVYDQIPEKIEKVFENDNEAIKSGKYIMNALYRENGQRNYISEGIKEANDEDIIIVSDVDEIPNLSKIALKELKEKIILFKQDMFYYKFNLKLPNMEWTGTKACKKKNFINAQWLRNIKDRKYPFYRLDVLFSKSKYIDVKIVKDGGWHFSNIKNAKEIKYKLKSYLHHREFDLDPLDEEGIKKIMENKQAIYDLRVDKTVNKIGTGDKLEKYNVENLPEVIKLNLNKYKEWLD